MSSPAPRWAAHSSPQVLLLTYILGFSHPFGFSDPAPMLLDIGPSGLAGGCLCPGEAPVPGCGSPSPWGSQTPSP